MPRLPKKIIILSIFIILVLIVWFSPLIGNWRTPQLESSASASSLPYTFPANFLWGVAVASQQSDHQSPSDWTAFENRAIHEGKTAHSALPGVAIPGNIASLDQYPVDVIFKKTDFNTRYPSDFKRMHDMGLNSFRFSFSWSKLFPRAGMSQPDPTAIRYYKDMLAEMKKAGLTPSATLFHFSSPAWFWQEKNGKRGWEREDAVALFSQLTQAIVDHFGQDINFWCTMNEPMVYIYNGYMTGNFPPLETRGGPKELLLVIENILHSHARAYKILHDYARAHNLNYLVGITKHTRAFEPLSNLSLLDRISAAGVEQAFIWDFQDAMQTGILKISGTDVNKQIEGLKNSFDYSGINYYGRFYIEGQYTNPTAPIIHMNDPNYDEPKNELGWAIFPMGFYKIIEKTYSKYHKPIYILENGTADCSMDDKNRKYFIVAHLRELALALQNKTPIMGYYHWTFTDNFEWAEGFEACFGLHKTDYLQNFKRVPRSSANLFSSIIQNGITPDLSNQYKLSK